MAETEIEEQLGLYVILYIKVKREVPHEFDLIKCLVVCVNHQ